MKPTDAAWLAGFLDGEGSFQVFRSHHRRTPAFDASIAASNADRRMLERCQRLAEGRIWSIPAANERQKPTFRWNIRGRMAGRVLLDVEPYIVGKREQVRILLALRASIEVPRQKGVWYQATRVPPNETAWREQLKLAVNALNTRGSGEPPAEQSHALAVVRGTLALEAQG